VEPDIVVSDTSVSVISKGYTARIFFRTNGLERPYYPRYGSRLFFTLNYTMNFTSDIDLKDLDFGNLTVPADNVWRAETGYLIIFPVGKSISLISDSRIGYTAINSDRYFNLTTYTFAGGYHPRIENSVPFYGAFNYDYSLNSYFMTKFDIQYEIVKSLFLTTGANLVSVKYPGEWLGEDADTSDLLGDTTYRLGLGISAGYYSIIGPLSVGLSWDTQRQEFIGNLNIGFYF
jgi:NTE family protein